MEGFRIIINRPALQSLEIYADDSSYCRKEVMAENQLYLNFSLPQYEEIPVGSTVLYSSEQYTLLVAPKVKKNHNNHYDYQLTLSASYAELGKYIIYNTIDNRLKFDYTAKAHEHLQLIIDNLNKRGGGWTIGECIESDEKLISYNLSTCMDALLAITEAFETEWEIVGKTINVRKVEYNKDNPLELSYGRGKGLCAGIERMSYNDEKPIGRLFVQGGERNIFLSTYGAKELHLPKDKTITYNGIAYKVSADGQYLERVGGAINGGNEGVLDLTHIYPSHTCEVESVAFLYKNNSYASRYDLISANPELNQEESSDWDKVQVNVNVKSEVNNPDYSQESIQVAGETMKAVFQSGMLGGREFDIHKYVHDTLTFELTSEYVDGYRMPAGYSYHPSVGDKFIVVGISLPTEYVTEAENKALEDAVKYLNEHESVKVTISANIDQIAAARNWDKWADKIRVGGYVRLSDDDLLSKSEDIRIKAVKYYLNSYKRPHVEMSNSIGGISLSTQIKQIESQEVHTNELHKSSLQFTRRKYADAQETAKLLESAFEDYAQAQKVISLETMQMVVGNEALQFAFTDGLTDNVIQPNIAYDSTSKTLSVSAISIKHYTLGITSMMPSNYSGDIEYKRWSVKAFSKVLDEKTPYFLYIKAPKESVKAEFVESGTAIKMDAESGYYHFLVGILNSESEGARGFSPLYGYTEILPSQVRTDAIVSADGKTKLDLLLGILNLNNYSGVSGRVDSVLGNKSIAAWFGGSMVDIEQNPNALDAAKTLFRQDGTGYLAGGNITWNEKGAGSVAGGALAWDENGSVLRGTTKIEGLTSLDNLVSNDTFNAFKNETSDTLVKYSKRITTTESKVGDMETALNNFLEGTDTDNIINNWKELEAFLEGMTETDNLATALRGKLDKTEFEDWKIELDGLYASKLALKEVSDRVAKFEDWFVLENGYIKATRGFFSDGTMGARAVGSTGGGGGGLIAYVYGYDAIEGVYYDTDKNNTFNAYTIAKLHSRIKGVENAGYITSSALNGYAKTSDLATKQNEINASNKLPYSYLSGVPDLSVYLTSHQAIYGLTIKRNGTSLGVYTPNSASKEIDITIPTKLSQFEDDVVSGKYLPLSGGMVSGTMAKPLEINTSASYVGIDLRVMDAYKGMVAWEEAFGTYIYEYNKGSLLGIKDGTPIVHTGGVTYDLIHSGNYSDYALPLSGGTITGDLTIKKESGESTLILGTNGVVYYNPTIDATTLYNGGSGFPALSVKAGLGHPVFRYNYQDYTLLHSGNVGEYAMKSYNNQGAVDYNNVFYNGIQYVSGSSTNTPVQYGILMSTSISDTSWQLLGGRINSGLYFRGGSNSGTGWGDWKTIAFTDSDITGNAGSATKLQTARTIWGQSFDGTGNVDGYLHMSGLDVLHLDESNLWLNYGAADDGKSLRLCGNDVAIYYGKSSNFARAMTINSSGNVLIGTTEDSGSILSIYSNGSNGRIKIYYSGTEGLNIGQWDGVTNRIESYGRPLLITSYSNPIKFGFNGDGNAMLINSYGNVGIGTADPQYKLDVNGDISMSNNHFIAMRNTAGTALYQLWMTGNDVFFVGRGSVENGHDSVYCGKTIRFSAGNSAWNNSGTFDESGNFHLTGAVTMASTLNVSGDAHFTGLITADSGIKIGDATITWDASANALKIDGNIYATGKIGAKN